MSDKGFIKLHRKITEWRWFKDPNTVVVWLAILSKAEWRNGQELEPGQLFITVRELCDITGLSPQKVRTALSHLTSGSTSELTSEPTNHGTRLTIENWRLYQFNQKEVTNGSTSDLTNDSTNLPLYKKNEEDKEEIRTATGTVEAVPMPDEFKEKLETMFSWRKDN